MSPPDSDFIAAFLTGQSVPGCTGLSAAQRDFQRRSILPAGKWLGWNFPYHETYPFPASVPLLRASLNNTWQYWRSRFPSFGQRHREEIVARFARYDTVILLAGSCGLELLNNLALPAETLQRIHLFAYGPVSRRPPATASSRLLQGETDGLSRLCHRQVDHRIRCGHMDYLAAPETLAHFNAYCRGILPGLPDAP